MDQKTKKIITIVGIVFLILFTVFQIYEILTMLFFQEAQTNSSKRADTDVENIIIRNGDTDKKQLTISCNVDWGEEIIPDMLQVFRDEAIQVTFFVSGRWAENNPVLLKDMLLAGHEIQCHGFGHKLCSKIGKAEVKEEIVKTEAAILKAVNRKTTVFAPPAGDFNQATVEVCKELGYDMALWSADTIDWREGSTATVIVDRILKKPLQGAIILMHPKEETLKALPVLIGEIKRQHIQIVPLYKLTPIKSES
ncbi:MAG: polysaccharide deacetylase family protein [Anaerovorax sp.]